MTLHEAAMSVANVDDVRRNVRTAIRRVADLRDGR